MRLMCNLRATMQVYHYVGVSLRSEFVNIAGRDA